MSDLKSTGSQNLLNIVKGLKGKRREKKSMMPKITEEITPVVSSDIYVSAINDKTNYAPPGYLVWNYYYDTPFQKIPNDTEIKLKTNGIKGQIIGFKDDMYKIFLVDKLIQVREGDFVLIDESKRELYNSIHIKNMKYHELHPPSKTLEALDLLQLSAKIIDTKGRKDEEEVVEDKIVGDSDRYSVILCIKKSIDNYTMGFRYRVWKLYVSSHDKKHLLFYDTLLIEREVDRLYEDNSYVKFYWAHSNGKPSLLPVESVVPSVSNLPDFKEGVEFIKTTKPQPFRQDGGADNDLIIENDCDDIGEIPELILQKYCINDDCYNWEIIQTYQPYPPRKLHAPSELTVFSKNPDTKKKYKDVLGKYEFIDRENYYGFIYKKDNYIIIKKAFNEPIEKVNADEYNTIQILGDNEGECDEDSHAYWFIARELGHDEYKTETRVRDDDENSIISRVKEVGSRIGEFFSGVRDKISRASSEGVEMNNDMIINRYFSDEDSNDSVEENIVRYKPIFYSGFTHFTNSTPLHNEWFLLDALKLERPLSVPIQIEEQINDCDRIVQNLNNNRFLLLPWSLDDITDHTRDERRTLKRDDKTPEIEVNSHIRIIKDFGYSGFNIRYFTGKVKSIKRDGKKKLYTIELDFPFITDEDIIVDDSFIEEVSPLNNLDIYFNAVDNLKNELSELDACGPKSYQKLIKKRISEGSNDTDKLLIKSNMYEYLRRYLENMVMNKDSIIHFNFTNISDTNIRANIDLSIELLKIDPYLKPTVREHIMDSLIQICKKICNDNSLERGYKCTIEDNWPPSIGDTVSIIEGLHKGKEGKIMEIKHGLNLSTNGEAIIKIKGVRSPYQITMNYLLKSLDKDKEKAEDRKSLTYNGFLRLSLTFVPTRGHPRVEIVDYEPPKRLKYNKKHINIGDYVKVLRGKYKGKILQVKEVDIDEKIEPGYYIGERAGDYMIMKDDRKIIRNGLQYRIRAVTADLYKLSNKREKNIELLMVYNPFNNDITDCELIDRDDGIKMIDRTVDDIDNESPLDRLGRLIGKRRR